MTYVAPPITAAPLVGNVNRRGDHEQKDLYRRSATRAGYDQLIDEVFDAGQAPGSGYIYV